MSWNFIFFFISFKAHNHYYYYYYCCILHSIHDIEYAAPPNESYFFWYFRWCTAHIRFKMKAIAFFFSHIFIITTISILNLLNSFTRCPFFFLSLFIFRFSVFACLFYLNPHSKRNNNGKIPAGMMCRKKNMENHFLEM